VLLLLLLLLLLQARDSTPIKSLEEELDETLQRVDIKNWNYVAVPRPAEEEE
jgi:hypothetical protein